MAYLSIILKLWKIWYSYKYGMIIAEDLTVLSLVEC